MNTPRLWFPPGDYSQRILGSYDFENCPNSTIFLQGRKIEEGAAIPTFKHFIRCNELLATLHKANPDFAQAARDVWESCFNIAALAEKTGKGDAKAWYQRAYDLLAEMKAKGRLIQAWDEKYLEILRQKLGK